MALVLCRAAAKTKSAPIIIMETPTKTSDGSRTPAAANSHGGKRERSGHPNEIRTCKFEKHRHENGDDDSDREPTLPLHVGTIPT